MKLKYIIKLLDNRISKSLIVFTSMACALFVGFVSGRISGIESDKTNFQVVDIASGDIFLPNASNTIDTVETFQLDKDQDVNKSLIFGSSKGKYFYYKGCGGNNLSAKNLVYYKSEADALAKGKVLYNKCE
ncbi:MAG: hypothetical protein QG614_502 [Patescibacteria group bacterium]|nr:hypothetical protein [Patescibacteria group bacterium]